jgi:hypothetical protein
VDISNQVKKVSGHEGTFKADSFFIGFEKALAPVDYVHCVDVLLVLGHSLESEIWVVGAACMGGYMLVK